MSRAAAQFEKIRVRIKELEKSAMPIILDEVAAAIAKQLATQFTSGTDPDGKAWEKPKAGGKPLVASGDLANSFEVKIDGDRVVVSTSVPYAVMNQGARNMLPKRRRIGRKWSSAIRKAVKAAKAKLKKIAKAEARAAAVAQRAAARVAASSAKKKARDEARAAKRKKT